MAVFQVQADEYIELVIDDLDHSVVAFPAQMVTEFQDQCPVSFTGELSTEYLLGFSIKYLGYLENDCQYHVGGVYQKTSSFGGKWNGGYAATISIRRKSLPVQSAKPSPSSRQPMTSTCWLCPLPDQTSATSAPKYGYGYVPGTKSTSSTYKGTGWMVQ
ncbi:MAG: hypothetical protein KDK51_03690 [Deltaproteobacteria bacterium]|nr:hypothetical protein [Deltaproteobacteria bacterium]